MRLVISVKDVYSSQIGSQICTMKYATVKAVRRK
jgi:hypothetical protein